MMKLYLLYRCPFAHRATMALQEKNLAFDRQFFERRQRPAELEKVGPHAKSPTLFDGDLAVWDSQVVLEYIEDRHPERPLLPAAAPGRAQVRMLAARVGTELGSPQGTVAVETLYKPHKDEAKIAQAKDAFLAALAGWDSRLEGRTFLVDDTLSLADITLFTVFPAMNEMTGIDIPPNRPHLRAWFERMSARPSSRLLEPVST